MTESSREKENPRLSIFFMGGEKVKSEVKMAIYLRVIFEFFLWQSVVNNPPVAVTPSPAKRLTALPDPSGFNAETPAPQRLFAGAEGERHCGESRSSTAVRLREASWQCSMRKGD